jgi:soluble lytic murein transglycosylase-like protein
MIKKLLAQVAILAVAGLTLTGLGAVTRALSGHGSTTALELAAEPVDSLAADSQLARTEDKLENTRAELERAHRILEFSGRYRIPADLSATIYDHAVAEGIPPALGFQLVKVESNFKNSAASYASAIGLTQLRILTARAYNPTLSESDLMNPSTNLQIGFRYLKDLLKRFDNDLGLALEAFNKGPTLLTEQIDSGMNVRGKYSRAVMSGMGKS